MDNFQAIGQLVIKAQDLLDSIKGGAIRVMQTQFDELKQTLSSDSQTALANFKSTSDAAITAQEQALINAVEPIVGKLPTIALTQNQVMNVAEGATLPEHFIVAGGMTLTHVETISENPNLRSGAQMQMLTDMESDIQLEYPDFDIAKTNYYISSFNVFRVSWDFSVGYADGYSQYTLYPRHSPELASVPISGAVSAASFIKLEDGNVKGGLASSSTLGKWKFSTSTIEATTFGERINFHPNTSTLKGSFLIALPVVTTGYLNHPKKLFALPGLI